MKDIGLHVMYTPPIVQHVRSAHDYLSDFVAESDLYDKTTKLLEFLDGWSSDARKLPERIFELWVGLYEHDYLGLHDVDDRVWPDIYTMPHWRSTFPLWAPIKLSRMVPSLPPAGHQLLAGLLTYDPFQRITAVDAVRTEYISPDLKPATSYTVSGKRRAVCTPVTFLAEESIIAPSSQDPSLPNKEQEEEEEEEDGPPIRSGNTAAEDRANEMKAHHRFYKGVTPEPEYLSETEALG
jgi:hypothetical protein